MGLDQAFDRKIQDHVHGGAALAQPTGLKVLLMTANGDPATLGTELNTGGGYTKGTGQSIAFAAATAATPTVSASSGVVTFANMPAATITGIEVWNSTARQEFGALAGGSKPVSAGDTLSFAAGAITSALQ